jgi:hypothetical protein
LSFQADEIRTIVRGEEQLIWVFAVLVSALDFDVGKRSYQTTLGLFRSVSSRINFEQIPGGIIFL